MLEVDRCRHADADAVGVTGEVVGEVVGETLDLGRFQQVTLLCYLR
jgi:hypothetical protein